MLSHIKSQNFTVFCTRKMKLVSIFSTISLIFAANEGQNDDNENTYDFPEAIARVILQVYWLISKYQRKNTAQKFLTNNF